MDGSKKNSRYSRYETRKNLCSPKGTVTDRQTHRETDTALQASNTALRFLFRKQIFEFNGVLNSETTQPCSLFVAALLTMNIN